ncbi:TonB-dependent receptor [Flavicella sp.]|uniref:SusC/RagA family TonB-linked outer membrane protein n=1 Tax=Flavicella sp. TaxID=2957742 RepID=UPI0026289EED|nr:TonB-dependent receptor [Flavicella sp.]MDG1805848.1 TonB-dependent receptor [Flavicella sp.]
MNKMKITFIALVMICTQSVFSQTKSISGLVTDESNSPLPGVSVLVVGTNIGVTTDFDGNFTIQDVSASNELEVSYIGMETQVIKVGNQSSISVTLKESSQALDEVVVVGYGSTSRKLVTGAISSVKSETITSRPITSADQALQGTAAGVTVSNTGSPGSSPQVQIRGVGTFGNSQPLYVIDGVVSGGLNEINPNDIETMDVLKDASTAAIYGSRASNGVIMITTKKGRSGKTKVTFDSYVSTQSAKKTYDLLNSSQFETFAGETYGLPNRYTVDPESTKLNTDWQDEVFRSAIMSNTNVNVSGGSETAIFNLSAGYLDQEGIIINTGFKRASIRANSEFKVGKRFKIGETLSIADSEKMNEENSGGRTLVEHMIKSLPYTPVYNAANHGGFGGTDTALDNGSDAENPVRLQTISDNVTETMKVLGSIYASFEVIDGLDLKFLYGFDRATSENNIFRPTFNEGINKRTAADINQSVSVFNSDTYTGSINYKKTFNEKHNVEALFVAEEFETSSRIYSSRMDNPLTDEIKLVKGGVETTSNNQLYEYKLVSYIGRLKYNYGGKYLISASLRKDGSSRFGENNRWGTFPAMSLGWVLSEEGFLSESNVISNLKLRGSWGVTGNDGSADYVYSAGLISGYNYVGFNSSTGYSNFAAENPDLKWEESVQTNIGLDLGLWNNAVTVSMEYYNTDNKDVIIGVPNQPSYGLGATHTTRNGASINTKGMEFSVGYNHNNGGDFSWSGNLNLGTAKNVVTDLNGSLFEEYNSFENENLTRNEVGESLFFMYGYQTDGLFQVGDDTSAQPNAAAGDIKYVDQNGDGVITSDDNVKIGNPFPNFTYGLTLTANYKQFDASMFLNGVSGNDVYNTNIYDLEGMTRLFNSGTAVLNRWTPTNTSTNVPRYTGNGGHSDNVNRSDRFVEDGSYTKLRNLTIGYSLSNSVLSKIAKGTFSKFRFYAAGQNLLTFTKYSGLDPEVGGSTLTQGQGSATSIGIDRGVYPEPRSFTLGLQVGF